MSEWVEKPLGKLASFKKGKKVDTSELPLDGYIPYLGASSLTGGSDGWAKPQGGIDCLSSDALMLWDGERSGLVGPGRDGVISSTVMRLRPESDMSGAYLVHLLRQNFDWIQARRTGTGVPHVPKDLGRILELRYPKDEVEQTTICDVLDCIETQIEATYALIAKQERLLAGLMQDLFTRGVDEKGELRPPHEEAPHLYHETELGWLPKGWEVGSILRYCTNERQPILTGPFGADLGSEDFVEDGVPLLRIGNVQDRYLKLDELLYVSERKALQLSKYRIVPSDLLFARQGATTGRNALASKEVDGALINYHIIRVSLDTKECEPRFVESMFNSWLISHQIEQSKGRGTREGINTQQIVSLKFPGPDLEEQRRLTLLLNCPIEEIAELKVELEKLRRQKTGLMQDLLTGTVSVEPLLRKEPA